MKKLKKLAALFLAVLMVLSLTPVTALADELELLPINAAEQAAEESLAEEEQSFVEEEAAVQEAVTQTAASSEGGYRIVHLDCGRKYFSVDNIKKLIDTMAQYGYNQLQLAFGNGGCRFLLDDMDLSYNGFTMDGKTVTANIIAGNKAFNSEVLEGDDRYLTQSEMDTIIAYANSKGIAIVPMLNMPGHATAIVYGTDYASSGNLNVNDETSRNYGYALLKKYVDYFSDKGCKYFHFGSDESGYSGENMTAFLTGCANVITAEGMTPRAFNDATNVATMPESVQITYWHLENHSKTAYALANEGYSMINTHGRWYYVVKTAQGSSEEGTKYWNGNLRGTDVSVELPTYKKTTDGNWVDINKFFDGYNDIISYGSTVTGSLGTMFCIWCDASQDAYLTDSDVISDNQYYGALYQLEQLAEHYWGDELKKGETTDAPVVTLEDNSVVPSQITKGGSVTLKADKEVTWTTSDSAVIDLQKVETVATKAKAVAAAADTNDAAVTGTTTVKAVAVGVGTATITAMDGDGNETALEMTVNDPTNVEVNLQVGQSVTFDVTDATETEGEKITGDAAYIATASVAAGTAQTAEIVEIKDANYAFNANEEYIIESKKNNAVLTNTVGTLYSYYDALVLGGAASVNSTEVWKIVKNGNNYTVQDANGKYLTFAYSTASMTNTSTDLTLTYTAGADYWEIKKSNYQSYQYLTDYTGVQGASALAGGSSSSPGSTDGAKSQWKIYKKIAGSTGGNQLTITGTGEGETTVTVGDVTYTINVTAPTTTETKTLNYGESRDLPEGATHVNVTGTAVAISADGKSIVAGNAEGNATVTFDTVNAGNKVTAKYVYTITVSEINFEYIDDLSVQLWITNTWVGANEPPTSLQTVNITAQEAYGEDGIILQSKVPSLAFKKDGGDVQVVYWRGVVLHGLTPTESGAGGIDYSKSGDVFYRVRYFDNSWQYSDYETNNWVAFTNNDTAVAYYLQKNSVAPEIVAATQNYGNPPSGENLGWSKNGFNMVAFAVVYPNGSLSRTEAEMYDTAMMLGFYENTSASIGIIYAENSTQYRVTKMTVTYGKNKYTTTDNTQIGYGQDWLQQGDNRGVNWDKVYAGTEEEWYDETTYWSANEPDQYGEIPMIDSEELTFTYGQKNAALVLIYLEEIVSDDNLNLVYWDDNADSLIHQSQIVVGAGVTYLNGLQNAGELPLTPGDITLNDNVYITNSTNVKQYFNKNIVTIPNVKSIYKSGIYEYKRAEISEDGKTLTLHYDLKQVPVKTYVVDFGLSIVIPATDFGIEYVNQIEKISLFPNEDVTENEGEFGKASISSDRSTLTYKLTKMIDRTATIPLYVWFNGETTYKLYNISIIPASNVYYEDSFVDFYDANSTVKKAGFTTLGDGVTETAGEWYVEGTSTEENAQQALEALGNKKTNVYGYDTAYNDSTTFSMGSAQKVTVNSTMAANWNDSTSAWPTATFTFKGTGFDIISLTDNNSGAIIVNVKGKDDANKDYDKNFLVNNYYGYKQVDGKWEVDTSGTENAIYQIPVMKVSELAYGNYDVTIKVAYNTFFDKTNDSQYSFWLDAIRIYNPMGVDNETYVEDGEGYPQYIKLRDNIADNSAAIAGETKMVFIDGGNTADVKTYANFGPNNEVYLAKGQAISFNIPANANIASIQIGAKAPKGSPIMTVGNKTETIATATEMYYEISKVGGSFTITNTGDGILSLTNLKITYSTKDTVSLAALTTEDQTNAVMVVRSLFAPPAPVVFEPATFTVKLSNYRDVYVREYVKVTVTTSDDVDYITVGDKKITRYTEERTWGGFRKGLVKTGNRIWSYYVSFDTAGQQVISVVAYDADSLASEAIENTVNVKSRSYWRGKTSEWHI